MTQLNTPERSSLVLASTSKHRAELLSRLHVDFRVRASDFDERAAEADWSDLDPDQRALALALGKARAVAAHEPQSHVLAADQIAYIPGPQGVRYLHKPTSMETAVDQLCALSGRTHHLVTGVVLLAPHGSSESPSLQSVVDAHELRMRAFDRKSAQAYVQRFRPLECVGAYRIEDAGITLFDYIRGDDYTGVIGLPLIKVAQMFRTAGLA